MSKSSCHQKVPLSSEDTEDIQKFFPHLTPCRIVPGGWLMPQTLDLEAIQNFEVFKDDVWIVTPPKCGTTWMQELAWLILHDVDLKAAEINQFFRFPFLELCSLKPLEELDPSKAAERVGYPGPEVPMTNDTVRWFMRNSIEYCRKMPRPRNIKTHLPLSVLPEDVLKKAKVIYVGRNVKDACVSWFHHMRMDGYTGDWANFARLFKENKTIYNPFIPHVLEAYHQLGHQNLFFTTYEAMSRDLRAEASRLIRFLGKAEQDIDMEKLLKAVHIESFRSNKFVNKETEVRSTGDGSAFIRKGQVGDWRNNFTQEMNDEWQPWIDQQLSETDYHMEFDLAKRYDEF